MGDGNASGNRGLSSNNKPEWLQQYDLIGKIGEGTYGLVFLARIKSPTPNRGKSIAIKKFKQSKDGDGVSPTAIREIMVPLFSSLPFFPYFSPFFVWFPRKFENGKKFEIFPCYFSEEKKNTATWKIRWFCELKLNSLSFITKSIQVIGFEVIYAFLCLRIGK